MSQKNDKNYRNRLKSKNYNSKYCFLKKKGLKLCVKKASCILKENWPWMTNTEIYLVKFVDFKEEEKEKQTKTLLGIPAKLLQHL